MENGTIVLQTTEPSLVGDQLDQLAEMWLDDCADRLDGLGPAGYVGTVRGYATKIGYFRSWWAGYGLRHAWRLTPSSLVDFERWLRAKRSKLGGPLAYESRRVVLRRVRSMFHWAEAVGHILGVRPSTWVPVAVGRPPVRQLMTDDQLAALMAAARSGRDRAMLAVLIGTGIRRAECARLIIDDVQFVDAGGVLVIQRPKRTSRSSARLAAFDAATAAYLQSWLAVRPAAESAALFPSRRGGHLHVNSVTRIVRRCWRDAGLESAAPVHDLRRKFVSAWRRRFRGDDMDELLRRQVGHTSPTTTAIYDLRGADELVEVIRSPVADLGIAVDWLRSV